MKMTLSKAMKHKNRVAQKLSRISGDIQTNNSILAVNEPEVDVQNLNKVRMEIVEHLVDLKTAIHKASNEIRHDIFRMSELRQSIQFYRSINTQHGKTQAHRFGGGGDDFVEYKAIMRRELIENSVTVLEAAIDAIQDKLDAFNAATTIEINIPESMSRPVN